MSDDLIEKANKFIDRRNYEALRYIIKNVKGEDVKKLQKFFIEKSKNEKLAVQGCYYFALKVEGADIKALQKAVIKSGDARGCFLFARDVKGADKEALGIEVFKVYYKEHDFLFHHRPTKTLHYDWMQFTYKEAIKYWKSRSSYKKFGEDCVKIAKKLLKLDNRKIG